MRCEEKNKIGEQREEPVDVLSLLCLLEDKVEPLLKECVKVVTEQLACMADGMADGTTPSLLSVAGPFVLCSALLSGSCKRQQRREEG